MRGFGGMAQRFVPVTHSSRIAGPQMWSATPT